MKRIIKFMLLAAFVLPAWLSTAAQEVYSAVEAVVDDRATLSASPTVTDVIEQPAVAPQARGKIRKHIEYTDGSSMLQTPMRDAGTTVTPPSSATIEVWDISTSFYYNETDVGWHEQEFNTTSVQVAFDGNDVYICGLCYWVGGAWVKGTFNSTKTQVTFSSPQYYGTDSYGDNWFVGRTGASSGSAIDVVFNYNEALNTLSLASGTYIWGCSSSTGSGRFDYQTNTVISKPTSRVDVADGDDSNSYLPVYGYYFENLDGRYQMIYPKDMLTELKGRRIKSITFYTSNSGGITFGNPNGTQGRGTGDMMLTLGVTNDNDFGTAATLKDFTAGATSTTTPVYQADHITFTFDPPYDYTDGTNLIMQTQVTEAGEYAQNTTFAGVTTSNNQSYHKVSSTSTATLVKFLPKVTFVFEESVETEELDFGSVDLGNTKTLGAVINNPNDEAVSVTISTSAPFSVVDAPATLPSGLSTVRVKFEPAKAINYSGNLTIDMNGEVKNIRLKGVGNDTSGPEALRDSTFFAGITYEWTDSLDQTHVSRLDETATDPDQMIAMLKEIYTNKDIPGNFRRGYKQVGAIEGYSDVYYTGVGRVKHTSGGSYTDVSGYEYENNRGWGIPGDVKFNSSGSGLYAAFMDTTQYKPNNEGVTLLLVEVRDDFEKTGPTMVTIDEEDYVHYTTFDDDTYKNLRQYFVRSVKSVRVVSEAMRTGTGVEKGTLFKVDCDKMNKFFFLAKGQVRWEHNSYQYKSNWFSAPPGAIYDSSTGKWGDRDVRSHTLFYHMFEEFSPVANDADAPKADIYQDLVRMQSFAVEHDCMGIVPLKNHQFQMYGYESAAADCQDVRDLMFFVPDYRMLYWNNSSKAVTARENSKSQKYLNYNPTYAPKMGLYVIIQDEIVPTKKEDNYMRLTLTWDSNMDEFLPSNQQEYQLWEIVTDEYTGVESYRPVWYMNDEGKYTDAQGQVLSNQDDPEARVQVVLTLTPDQNKVYTQVYVPRYEHSYQVTYVIRGQDKADPTTGKHFLSLKASNRQSYIVPGTDPSELVLLKDASHYSRFDAQRVRNAYSNKLIISNTVDGLKQDYITSNTNLTITRQAQGATEPITIATITFNPSSRQYKVEMNAQDAEDEFPVCRDNSIAGYHANTGIGQWKTYSVTGGIISLGSLVIYDNFVVDVSSNAHPNGYIYNVTSNYTDDATGSATAHSNTFRVPIYKTASLINGSFTKQEVDEDDAFELGIEDIVKFDAQVQYSSKTEIYRYDAYRWTQEQDRYILASADGDDEEDIAPNGTAGNQDGYYTVSMNVVGTDDYTSSTVSVNPGENDKYANFVDPIPGKESSGAKAYIYAPVIETFVTGKDEDGNDREDYNTYGGPLQNTAAGLLDVSVVEPSAQVPLMSNFDWTDNGKKYAYYQIFLNVEKAEAPEGYSLYGIRAWRHVPQNLLGEHPRYPRPERVPTDDEDIMFEKILGGNGYDPAYNYLGTADVTYSDAQPGEVRATFGAQKLRTTEAADDQSVIDSFNAEFTVRLYFTPAPIYVYANPGGNDIDCNNAIATLYSDDGKTYSGTVTIPDKGDGTGYFVFSKKIGSNWETDNQYIFGAQWDDAVALVGSQGPNNIWDFNLRYWSGDTRSFKITPGTYKFEITNHIQSRNLSSTADWSAGNLKITPVTANAGLRDGAAGATGKFYIVEKELTFTASKDNVVTGIFDIQGVKDVVGVKYYNVAGIESDKPFDGVNIVVTRYNDGSVATSKMIK